MLEALATAALRTLLLTATVQFALALLRIRRPQLLLAAWTAVLAASLAMPALQRAPPLDLPVLPSPPAADWAIPLPQPDATPVPAEPTTPPLPLLPAAYLAVASALLLRLLLGSALALRLVRTAIPVRAPWAAGARVRLSRHVSAPVTVARTILLPIDALAWAAPMRDAVMAHERAHVDRRDHALLLVAQLNRALFWFSPAAWWLHRRLAALAEQACDDQAVATTNDRPAYAATLLDMARRAGPLMPGPPLNGLEMARPATVPHRIERLLSAPATTPAARCHRAAPALAVATLAIAAAGTRPAPTPLPPAARSADHPAPPPIPALAAAPARAPPRAQPPRPAPPARPARLSLPSHPPRAPARPQEARAPVPAPPAPSPATPAIEARATFPARPSGEPSCTATLEPRPGHHLAGASDLVMARFFLRPDGTPWLKLSLGERARRDVAGAQVEVTQVRTTVLTAVPASATLLRGTTQAPDGTITYECKAPGARL